MAAADKLAGYRDNPKSNVPQPVEDKIGAPPSAPHEGEDAVRQAAAAPVQAVPLVTGDRTPMFVDHQRQRLAERFKADRAAERATQLPASHVPFIDGDDRAIPGADVRTEEERRLDEGEDLDPDEAAANREKIASDEAARDAAKERFRENAAQPPARPYTLTVDRNQFNVSRDELLHYAEIDPQDAGQFSDVALVRLAQKQIAASNRLAEANAFKDRARQEASQGQQPQPQRAPAPQPQEPDPALVAAVEAIQLGDPKEAAQRLQAVFNTGVGHAIAADNQVRALGDVQQEYARAVGDFSYQHPEITGNSRLARAHIAFVSGEIADDLQALGLVTEDQHAAIAVNPRLAADVLTAAMIERRPMRSPSQIFQAASDKIAAFLPQGTAQENIAQTRPNFTPAPATNQRIAEKRALMSQPARSGTSQIGSGIEPAPEEDRIERTSRIIKETRKARFQPTS